MAAEYNVGTIYHSEDNITYYLALLSLEGERKLLATQEHNFKGESRENRDVLIFHGGLDQILGKCGPLEFKDTRTVGQVTPGSQKEFKLDPDLPARFGGMDPTHPVADATLNGKPIKIILPSHVKYKPL